MPTYKIHPTIGFARVGNSPDFFIGPEKRYQPPNPTGGFKDGRCRVKRQAARFRIFEYPDTPGGTPVELDVVASGATLTWKVQLSGADERTVTGTGGSTEIHKTTNDVFLGELRTDKNGRLVLLGGLGWMSVSPSLLGSDDTTDGYVHATLVIGGNEVPVAPAWIVVAGPKFAPQLDYIVTLWDVAENRIQGTAPLSGPVSYTEHIYPILKRAQDIRWVRESASGHHTWDLANVSSLPREQIFEALKVPLGVTPPADPNPLTVPPRNMPALSSLTLTRLQYLRMQAFYTNTDFVNDWAGEPVPSAGPPTPSELDRAALEACCGGSFSPGVEVDGSIVIPTLYEPTDPLRLKTGSGGPVPGQLRGILETPWAKDYMLACQGFWPIAAPGQVLKGAPGSEVYEE